MRLSHVDADGNARMVEVSEKAVTAREAVASGAIVCSAATLALVRERRAAKGDVLGVAQIAGIQAAKRTGELIPLCHPLPISGVDVRFELLEDRIRCEARVATVDRTGVEMEAMTAVSVALLTVYDMLKAVERGMVITDVRLERKTGGRSGTWERA